MNSNDKRILSAIISASGQRALRGLQRMDATVCPAPSAAELQGRADNLAELAASQRVAEAQAKAEGQRKQDLSDRIQRDVARALATEALLRRTEALLLAGNLSGVGSQRLADFRAELQPLAKSYGVKIVLIGDRTTATLVTL